MDSQPGSKKGLRGRRGLIVLFCALLIVGTWLVLFVRPTLNRPGFLRKIDPASRDSRYEEGTQTVSRGGRLQVIPVASVTEINVFLPRGSFASMLSAAQAELTGANGWDLQALPREHLAVFHQKSTGSVVRIQAVNGEVRVVVYQSRYATPLDRIRNWIGMYQKRATPPPN